MKPQYPTHARDDASVVVWKAKDCLDLPSLRTPDGIVSSEWEPTAEELDAILRGAPIILWQWTGGGPLQPQACSVGAVPGGCGDD